MTRDESREAILSQWQRLPAWKRRTSQDAAEFAHIMLTSRPDLTDFECPFDRFLVLRGWLAAEQRPAALASHAKRSAAAKATRLKAAAAAAVVAT